MRDLDGLKKANVKEFAELVELLTSGCINPFELWAEECNLAKNTILYWLDYETQGEAAVEAARRLLSVAQLLEGKSFRKKNQ